METPSFERQTQKGETGPELIGEEKLDFVLLDNLRNRTAIEDNYRVYFSETIKNLRKTDIFPKDYVPPRGIQSNFYKKLRSTKSIEACSLVIVPHEWQDIFQNQEYVHYLNEISEAFPVIIFNTGDVSPPVNIRKSIQIRTFLHPGENPTNKVLIPYPIKGREFKPRKWSKVPKVGFMGQVPKISPGSLLSRPNLDLLSPVQSSVYLNRKIGVARLHKLNRGIETEIVVRPSFSAINKNVNFKRESQEFQTQLFSCDYILCPRGYGNTSIRFYETISAGRTPILIESGGGLPELVTGKSWDNHILSVGLFENWSKIILQDWGNLCAKDKYINRQLSNVELFDSQLNFEKYMEILFSDYLENGV